MSWLYLLNIEDDTRMPLSPVVNIVINENFSENYKVQILTNKDI